MIPLTVKTSIMLACQPADFRKGIDGFVALCEHHLHQAPRSGTLFVFINRAKTMIRILAYESNGYWLMTKRLSKGRFDHWPKSGEVVQPLPAQQLRHLLANMLDSRS